MSQQEFEQQDQQAMRIANREQQKKCAAVAAGRNASRDARAAEAQRRMLWTAIQVLSCVLAATLFVAALMDTAIVVFLANAGVLVCGMVAAVKIDRAVRDWRKR